MTGWGGKCSREAQKGPPQWRWLCSESRWDMSVVAQRTESLAVFPWKVAVLGHAPGLPGGQGAPREAAR